MPMSLREAKKRIESKRDDVELCEETYVNWKDRKAKFFDKIEQDYFWTTPERAFKKGVTHPERSKRRRRETMLQKYGVEHPSQAQEIKEKKRQTALKNYGVEHPSQAKEVRQKVEQTNLERYGSKYYVQTEESKQKIRATNLERYGVEHHMHNKSIKNKVQTTCQEKYGSHTPFGSKKIRKAIEEANLVKYGSRSPFGSKEVQEKSRQTLLKNYGVNGVTNIPYVRDKILMHYIPETNEPLVEWYEKQPDPKPSYCNVMFLFKTKRLGIKELESFFSRYKPNKTHLETFTEELLGLEHFNRKPAGLQRLYKPDFKLNETTYLNVDGLYWHSEKVLDKWYHFEMRKHFEEHGLRLFQIREDELYLKSDIVKSIVNHVLGVSSSKIYARNCYVSKVPHSEAATFLVDNHLMGLTKAKHIGLYDRSSNQLVSILSYKQKQNICKIERFCSILNASVVGGFSKLLKHLEQNCLNPEIAEIHNWVDLRYGTGAHLAHKGFRMAHEALGWKWTDGYLTFNRLRCRANMDERKLSMQEHADELEWVKLYDGGQRLWVKKL